LIGQLKSQVKDASVEWIRLRFGERNSGFEEGMFRYWFVRGLVIDDLKKVWPELNEGELKRRYQLIRKASLADFVHFVEGHKPNPPPSLGAENKRFRRMPFRSVVRIAFPVFGKLCLIPSWRDRSPDWDFDKAAFAAAAEDVFKYLLKTIEREKKVRKLRNVVEAFERGGEKTLPEDESPSGKGLTVRGIGEDARWRGDGTAEKKGIEDLLKELSRSKELDQYGLRAGTIGGWAEVRKALIKVHKHCHGKKRREALLPNLLVRVVDNEQTANRQGFGSADFFHALCEPAYHHLWLPSAEHNGIKDFIPHYVKYWSWKEELLELQGISPEDLASGQVSLASVKQAKPISYTWPGLLNRHHKPSYRYHDFKASLNEKLEIPTLFRRVKAEGGGIPTYLLIDDKDARTITLSARRLKRDKIMTAEGNSVDALWCPPLVLGSNGDKIEKGAVRAGKKKDGKWPTKGLEVSFSLMAAPAPDDSWIVEVPVETEKQAKPVHLKVAVPIDGDELIRLINHPEMRHWAKGSLRGVEENDDKRSCFKWPIDLKADKISKAGAGEKTTDSKLWCGDGKPKDAFPGFRVKNGKFNSDADDVLHVPDFHLLAIDLGNRFAAASARLRVHAEPDGKGRVVSGDGFFPVIKAETVCMETLRLQGEGAWTWQIVTDKNRKYLAKRAGGEELPNGRFVFQEEPYGNDGRGHFDPAAPDRIKELADKLVPVVSCSLAGVEKMTYPEIGDHLVFRLKRHVGRLRTLFNLLWRVAGSMERNPKAKGIYTQPRTPEQGVFHQRLVVETLARGAYPKRPRLNNEVEDPNDQSLRDTLADEAAWKAIKEAGLLDGKKGREEEERQKALSERVKHWNWSGLGEAIQKQIKGFYEGERATAKLLVAVIEFCLPLRGRHWGWNYKPSGSRLGWGKDNEFPYWKPNTRGMRGISMKRLEQVLNLRMRCQSYAKLEDRYHQRFVKLDWNPLDPMKRGEADDVCPVLLDKSNRLRDQRVDQTAHLILAEALGLKLKNPADVADKKMRNKIMDLHGEYERKVGKDGKPYPRCSVIVLENLERYKTSQQRTKAENSRLMQWAHRNVVQKLEDLCKPFGITIMLVDPSFSSRFDCRSGLPGVRVNSVSRGFDQQMPYASWAMQQDSKKNPTKLAQDIAAVKRMFEEVSDFKGQLMIPVEGGKEFLPVCAKEGDALNADINAAVNIGLRAAADPSRWDIFPRLRTVKVSGDQVRVTNRRGWFAQFAANDDERLIGGAGNMPEVAAASGPAATGSTNAVVTKKPGKRRSVKAGDEKKADGDENESSGQSSEFPPYFTATTNTAWLTEWDWLRSQAVSFDADSAKLNAFPQGAYLKRVEELCSDCVKGINAGRIENR
jgi:IS605 OrfB family transposase